MLMSRNCLTVWKELINVLYFDLIRFGGWVEKDYEKCIKIRQISMINRKKKQFFIMNEAIGCFAK